MSSKWRDVRRFEIAAAITVAAVTLAGIVGFVSNIPPTMIGAP